jgi:xylulokinase
MLNYRSRSAAILDTPSDGSLASLNRVYATGGASANPTILSLMADILSAPVVKNVDYDPKTKRWTDVHWNACSVGVAYKARWGWERHHAQGQRKWVEFDTFVQECRERRAEKRRVGSSGGGGVELEEEGIRAVAVPGEGAAAWEKSVEWWKLLEARAVIGK